MRKYLIIVTIILSPVLEASDYDKFLSMYKEGEKKEAIVGFRNIIQKEPYHEKVANINYILAFEENNSLEALNKWKDLYYKYSDFEKRDEAAYRAAMIHIMRGEYEEGKTLLIELDLYFTNSQYTPKARLLLGGLCLDDDEVMEATRYYRKVAKEFEAEKNAYYYEAIFGIANTLYVRALYESASEYYYFAASQGSTNFSERPLALYRLGACYEKESVEKAEEKYLSVIKNYPLSYAASLARQKLRMLGNDKYKAFDKMEEILAKEKVSEKKDTLSSTQSVEEDDDEEYEEIEEEESLAKNETASLGKDAYFQAGRFSEKSRAKALAEKITNLDIDAMIEEDAQSESFRVLIICEDNEEAISKMQKTLNSVGIEYFRVRK